MQRRENKKNCVLPNFSHSLLFRIDSDYPGHTRGTPGVNCLITINVPVVYMVRYIVVLRGANP